MDIGDARQIVSAYLDSEVINSDAEKIVLLNAFACIASHVAELNISMHDLSKLDDARPKVLNGYISVKCRNCHVVTAFDRNDLQSRLGENINLKNIGQCYDDFGKCEKCGSKDILVFDKDNRLLFDSEDLKRCIQCGAPLTELLKAHDNGATTCMVCKESPPENEDENPKVPSHMKVCPVCGAPTEARQRNDDGEWYIACIKYNGRFARKDSGACSYAASFPEEAHLDGNLYDALKQWRANEADRLGVKRYFVATNKQLKEISIAKPITKSGLLACHGIGENFVERYGDSIIAIIKEFK